MSENETRHPGYHADKDALIKRLHRIEAPEWLPNVDAL